MIMLKNVLKNSVIFLIVSCNQLKINPYVIDNKTGELVNKKNERVSVYDDEAKKFMCLDFQDTAKVIKKLRNCANRK